jgi:hypothetical protein
MTDDARRARLVAPWRPDATKRPIVVGTDVPAVSRGSAIRLFFCCRVVFGCGQKIGGGWGRPTPTSAIGSTTQNDVGPGPEDPRQGLPPSPVPARLPGDRRPNVSAHVRQGSVRRPLSRRVLASCSICRIPASRPARRRAALSIDPDVRSTREHLLIPRFWPSSSAVSRWNDEAAPGGGSAPLRAGGPAGRVEEGDRLAGVRYSVVADRPVAIPRGKSALAGGGASAGSLAA